MKYQKISYIILGCILILGGVYLFSLGENDDLTQDISILEKSKETHSVFQGPERTQEIDTNSHINQIKENISSQTNDNDSPSIEYRIVAEEILYPNEFDFGHLLDDSVLKAVGKPIKFDAIQIASMKIGDVLTLELDGKNLVAHVQDITLEHFDAKDTNPGDGAVITYRFNGIFDSKNEETYNNSVYGSVTINSEGVLYGNIEINAGFGSDYRVFIYKALAYYATDRDMQFEFGRQGYKID